MATLTDKDLALVSASAKVFQGVIDQLPSETDVTEFTKAVVAELMKASNETVKQSPIDLTENALALASAVAEVIGNPKVVTIVNDIQATADDALQGKFGALIGDLIKDYKDLKALKK